ncbi:protein of unknown function [Verrucomicrobium sp. GAS474]|uniref:DUF5069 domain-containing protein n=1 Tax=Verrucomicrobium sp. GAS474 TaxID=1882831 RepID=UPI00087C3158|nr:DUF5069 domain-containing protein [Verrucomicrobium sp. GAS474]SDT85791.1 protein of unknown function [Verrucomicrobium sp. GAS474]
MSKTSIPAPDLSQRPPRSPRVRLGGFPILPRALDKGRAKAAGKAGEYHYNCPLDQSFFDFVQVDGGAVLKEIKKGKGDWEILEWILANAKRKPTPWEIDQWASFVETRTFDTVQSKERILNETKRLNANRSDLLTRFDLLDLDDHVTFGGKA